jgi:hypothetical protein
MSRPEFIKLSATYQVAQGSTANELLEDSYCLMNLVSDSLTALAMGIDVSGDRSDITNERGFCQILYGLGYLADMGSKASSAAHSIVLAAGVGDQS